MINVTELKAGNYFLEDGNIYQVLDTLLNKTAMRKMVVKVKIKNVRTRAISEISRNSGYMIDVIRLDKSKMLYLFESGDMLTFMDQETYEQIEVPKDMLDGKDKFLKGNEELDITMYEGEVLEITLPAKVALQIVECEPAVKGDTVNAARKEATLETGLKIKVPLFIENGETVLVRTDTGEYDGRA